MQSKDSQTVSISLVVGGACETRLKVYAPTAQSNAYAFSAQPTAETAKRRDAGHEGPHQASAQPAKLGAVTEPVQDADSVIPGLIRNGG